MIDLLHFLEKLYNMTIPRSRRLASIDVFRAITMCWMIFVNDLVLDEKVPRWLEHAAEGEDRLGMADTVFPAFLFIVGLSIVFAVGTGNPKECRKVRCSGISSAGRLHCWSWDLHGQL